MTATSPAAFADVRKVWEAARNRGFLVYELETQGKAVNFMQRAYRFRKMLLTLESERVAELPGLAATTPYDHIGIKREGRRLTFFERRPEGKLYDEDGNEISFEDDATNEPDELVEAARAARDALGLDIE